ncbi:sigma-70 family RNA polymerase sigma factor [Streptomyces albus subsp. chlorinus]|nr:sigma-70 family RNA polymerase sigma factor [Streptomyces albus subsp. chlorinus]
MREGDDGAYEELYRRHAEPVRRYARTCCRDADTAEDLTGEVFARTLQAVRGGKGPQVAVRAYLLASVRHVAAAWARTRRRERLVDDFAVFVQSAAAASAARDVDTLDLGAEVRAMLKAERTLVVRAFKSLSEYDRMLLWHTAVEGSKPQEVALLLGTSRGAAATAAHRAREHLKQAYLQAHVSTALTAEGECARFADRLGAYARGGLRMRAERGVARHLEECSACSEAVSEVKDLNEHIRLLVPVAIIGWFGTAGGAKAFAALIGGGGAAAAAGGAGAATGGAGAGAASEGLGTPAKVGIGLGVAAAAGAVLAYALTGGDDAPPEKPQARPSAPPAPPGKPRDPKPAPRPGPVRERPPAPTKARPEAPPRRESASPPRRESASPPEAEPPKPVPGPPDEPVRRPAPPVSAPPPAPPHRPRPTPPPLPPADGHFVRVAEDEVVLSSTNDGHTVRLVVKRHPTSVPGPSGPSRSGSGPSGAGSSGSGGPGSDASGAGLSATSWAHSLSRRAIASSTVSGAAPGSRGTGPAAEADAPTGAGASARAGAGAGASAEP